MQYQPCPASYWPWQPPEPYYVSIWFSYFGLSGIMGVPCYGSTAMNKWISSFHYHTHPTIISFTYWRATGNGTLTWRKITMNKLPENSLKKLKRNTRVNYFLLHFQSSPRQQKTPRQRKVTLNEHSEQTSWKKKECKIKEHEKHGHVPTTATFITFKSTKHKTLA